MTPDMREGEERPRWETLLRNGMEAAYHGGQIGGSRVVQNVNLSTMLNAVRAEIAAVESRATTAEAQLAECREALRKIVALGHKHPTGNLRYGHEHVNIARAALTPFEEKSE